jgi:hypothetical protein
MCAERGKTDVIRTTGAVERNEQGSLCVTFGVTWGKQTYSSASCSEERKAERTRGVTKPSLSVATHSSIGRRGKFVETISSAAKREAPKSLKNMVGTTGIEPVTPTMSR